MTFQPGDKLYGGKYEVLKLLVNDGESSIYLAKQDEDLYPQVTIEVLERGAKGLP